VAQGLPHTIAAAIFAASVVHCSLTAPSDQELMGGNKGSSGDAGRSDAMDGAGGGDGGGMCLQTGDCCTPGACCAGLVCDVANSGVCIACMQAGGSCFGGNNMCCSGNCVGHTCR
jgi:hypothetical protein